MNYTFKNMTINHIQVEECTQLAEVEVEFTQGKVCIETTLILGSTDLNKLFALLNTKGLSISLTDDFDCFSTYEGDIYTLDFSKKNWDEIQIEQFCPLNQVKQIRA